MTDLATNHPRSSRKPTHGGKLDREVIRAFDERPDEMHDMALLLRAGVEAAAANEPFVLPEPDSMASADEGELISYWQSKRGRNSALRRRKFEATMKRKGSLACEACAFDFYTFYGTRGLEFAECHHVQPLHSTGPTVTTLKDLAVLCSNCHRMIHRGPDWLSVEELRNLVDAQKARQQSLPGKWLRTGHRQGGR